MKIAVYAICKNEEKHLLRFLDSCKGADGVFILDTGSTDSTWVQLSDDPTVRGRFYSLSVKQQTFSPWRFDAPRNAALAMVPEDYDLCLALDLDEVLPDGWREEVEKVWRPGVHQVRYEFIWNHHLDGSPNVRYWAQKMHSRHGWEWVKPVHEILKFTGPGLSMVSVDCPIVVHHWADDTKSRSSYLPLLELSVQEDPADDRNAHYLGREYFNYGHWVKAINELGRHLALPSAKWGAERAASHWYMAQAEEKLGNQEARFYHLREAVKEAPGLREPWVDLALALYKTGDHPGAYAMAKSALVITVRPRVHLSREEAWGAMPWDILAVCAYVMERYQEAYEAGKQAAILAPNDARILNNLAQFERKVPQP